jgi:hypothetical protein
LFEAARLLACSVRAVSGEAYMSAGSVVASGSASAHLTSAVLASKHCRDQEQCASPSGCKVVGVGQEWDKASSRTCERERETQSGSSRFEALSEGLAIEMTINENGLGNS